MRPELYLATFTCAECQAEIANVPQHYKFTEPLICPNPTCGNRWAPQDETANAADLRQHHAVQSSAVVSLLLNIALHLHRLTETTTRLWPCSVPDRSADAGGNGYCHARRAPLWTGSV